jgi:FkbH-like protein
VTTSTVLSLFDRYRAAVTLRSLLTCVRDFDAQSFSSFPASQSAPAVRLALTGNYSTQFLAKGFPLALAARGLPATMFESGYNAWQVDLLDPDSALYAFNPTHVLLTLTSIDLAYGALRSPERVAQAVAAAANMVLTRSEARLLVTLPEPLAEERSDQSSAYTWRRDTRARLTALLDNPRINLIDMDPLVRQAGDATWHDDRLYDISKLPFHPDQTPRVLARLAAAVAGTVLPQCKVVICDLDGTLWGGRAGEEGWNGVDLDAAGAGRHHLRLQMFIKGLTEQGVLLAIASKNETKPVHEVFERRPEMIVRLEDFSAAQIHWGPKSASVESILAQLNLTSMGAIFIDDNPVEREEVRRRFPEMFVPELPLNPADWVPMLIETGLFDRRVVTEDSARRQTMYRENEQRAVAQAAAGDIHEFLSSLEMELTAYDAAEHRDRVVELIQKTNQFNLTTRRYAWPDVRAAAEGGFALCYQLTDRFGDNGVISVVIVKREIDDEYSIDLWLMSCRIMSRTVENAIMDDLLNRLAAIGARRVIGRYIPTEKNVPVSHLYERLGFVPLPGQGGEKTYEYGLLAGPFTFGSPHIHRVDRVLKRDVPIGHGPD